jgi:nucleoside-diphosphate-sugar epimerase
MASILVTGANGFIGTHLVETLLARNEPVAALVRNPASAARFERSAAQIVRGDVTDLESIRRAVAGRSAVFHLAGVTKTLRAKTFFEVNCRGVAHLARACAEQSAPPTLVVVSSLAAAGPTVDGRPREEADKPQPISSYGRSKRAGEKAAERYAAELPITIVRPSIVFGEGDRMSLEMFKTVARSGVHPVPGLAPRYYSMIHADDLVEILLLAAERGKRLPPRGTNAGDRGAGYYFAACDEHPSWYQLGRMIGKALGRKRTLTLPFAAPIVRLVGLVGELAGQARGRQVTMNLDKAREATAGSWICSPNRARRELGFSINVPLADRLAQTARWYRQAGWL